MDLNQRKQWNVNHKKLTNIILKPAEHQAAVDLFLKQHSLLHASEMSHSPVATLEDELVTNLGEETWRTILYRPRIRRIRLYGICGILPELKI
ncbi:hypothetical protein [Paenibacillus solani]|uniref:hypothetical protein n=1 Tax=Paenibacillus solani TaxID=1705565 RepID=UPI0030FED655